MGPSHKLISALKVCDVRISKAPLARQAYRYRLYPGPGELKVSLRVASRFGGFGVGVKIKLKVSLRVASRVWGCWGECQN